MGQLGVHFAVTAGQLKKIEAAKDDDALMEVIEEIEEAWDKDHLAETDKAWDAIHRCLTDGSLLYDTEPYPLSHVICGGRQLYDGEDYTVALVTPDQVKDVAKALESIDKDWMRERYFSLLRPGGYDGEIGETDFEYTWEWFLPIRDLYRKAASKGRAVIFTVDA